MTDPSNRPSGNSGSDGGLFPSTDAANPEGLSFSFYPPPPSDGPADPTADALRAALRHAEAAGDTDLCRKHLAALQAHQRVRAAQFDGEVAWINKVLSSPGSYSHETVAGAQARREAIAQRYPHEARLLFGRAA